MYVCMYVYVCICIMYMYLCTMPRGKKRSAKGSNFKEDNSSLPHYTVHCTVSYYSMAETVHISS